VTKKKLVKVENELVELGIIFVMLKRFHKFLRTKWDKFQKMFSKIK